MSIVVLSGKHYDSVANYLIKFNSHRDHSWVKYQIANWYQIEPSSINDKFLIDIVKHWQKLNTEAYNGKYGEDDKDLEDLKNGIDLDDYGAVRALKSIDYQIEESHIDDDYANKESLDVLERMIGLICRIIVTSLMPYKKTNAIH